jgi:hypothetical protein
LRQLDSRLTDLLAEEWLESGDVEQRGGGIPLLLLDKPKE